MASLLRPFTRDDLDAVPGGDSPYDDWGPGRRTEVPGSDLDGSGGLVIAGEDGRAVGSVSWHYLHWGPNAGSRNPMIGIWLARVARGQGLGTRAQVELVDLIFRHTHVNRVEAHTDVTNAAEAGALERAGFTREGVIRGAQWRDGAFHDGYLYSILRSDWADTTRSGG